MENTPLTSVPWVSFERFCPSKRKVTSSTVSKQHSAAAVPPTISSSSSAEAQFSASLLISMRAWPSAMSISNVVPSGITFVSPSRAAARSFCDDSTIRLSVAFAMPSCLGISRVTGTR